MHHTANQSLARLLLAVILLACCSTAPAEDVFRDDFNRPDGSLVETAANLGGVWLQTGTQSANPIQLAGNKATLGGFGQDAYAALTTPVANVAGAALKTSLDLNVNAAVAAGDYFLHFSDPVGTTFNFYQRLFVRPSLAGFQIGLVDTSGSGSSPNWGTETLSLLTTYHVDVLWNFSVGASSDTFSVAVDGSPYLAHSWSSTTVEPSQISALNLRQGTATNAPSLSIDNLVITTIEAALLPNNIFRWEYIDPLDPSQGKRESSTPAPDGPGLKALPFANLSGLNLTMAYLIGADLTGVNLASTNLTDADLSGAQLKNANLSAAILTNTNVSGADVRGAQLNGVTSYRFEFVCYVPVPLGCLDGNTIAIPTGTTGGINIAQLSTTASAQAGDLNGVDLSSTNLSSANFAGFNLTNANFNEAALSGANLSGADLRGGIIGVGSYTSLNLILPIGYVRGLDLYSGQILKIRDYDGNSATGAGPIPITVDQHFEMSPLGKLQIILESDAWDSTIYFTSGIPVSLGGFLELQFANGTNTASQVGRTFKLFDWTGVTPTGLFTVSSPYSWNLSNLYTTGEVTLTAVPEPTSLLFAAVVLLSVVVTGRLRKI